MEDIKLKISQNNKHIDKPLQVGRNYTDTDKRKLAKASRDFESMLSNFMLKSMTKTVPDMFGDSNSYGSNFLDGIFEMKMADYMSKHKSIGIAQNIYKKLTGEDLPSKINLEKYASQRKFNGVVKNTESDKIAPSTNTKKRVDRFEKIIDNMASEFNVNKNLIKSVIYTESAGNDKAVSKAKAKGLMQLMDATAKDLGVNNSFDPTENIYGGTKYLSQLLKKYDGDIEKTLAAYNAGPGNVEKYEGVPPFEETKNYITRVLGYYNFLEG